MRGWGQMLRRRKNERVRVGTEGRRELQVREWGGIGADGFIFIFFKI